MSVKVQVELPLHAVLEIHETGGYNDGELALAVISAVVASSAHPQSPEVMEDRVMADSPHEPTNVSRLTPSSREETFTLVESSSPTVLGDTNGAAEEFYIEIELLDHGGNVCDRYFPQVKSSMTGGGLHSKIETYWASKGGKLPLHEQRLLLNGQRIRHEDTLRASGVEPGSTLRLLQLVGACFPDSDLDFFIMDRKRWNPVHARSDTTVAQVVASVFPEWDPVTWAEDGKVRIIGIDYLHNDLEDLCQS